MPRVLSCERRGALRPRVLHRAVRDRGEARLDDRFGNFVTVVRCESLPLDREHPMTLKIAERAVVAEHVEAVAGPFERAAGLVSTVRPLADVSVHERDAIVGGEPAN